MEKDQHITDATALALLGDRVARRRLARNLTQAQLARDAGVSKRTMARLEAGESTQLTNLIRIIRALGLIAHLDALIPLPAPSPLEQLRSRGKQRRRASPRTDTAGDSA